MLILVAVTVSVVINSNLIGTAQNAANATKTAYEEEGNMSKVTIGRETYNLIDEYMQNICSHNYVNGNCVICGAPKQIITAEMIANATDKTKYYGKTVRGYMSNNGDEITWKIFYAGTEPGGTTNNIYLIASDYIPYTIAPRTLDSDVSLYGDYRMCFTSIISNANYTAGADSVALQNSPAKEWLSYLDYLDANTSITRTNDNMRITAMLLDESAWSGFAGEDAEYAIGGPTLDMFVASYNEYYEDDTAFTGTQEIYYESNTNGYNISKSSTVSDTVSVGALDTSNSLYIIEANPENGGKAYGMWIASPSAKDIYASCFVRYHGGVNIDYGTNYSNGFRPVVCLKPGISLTKISRDVFIIE